MNLIATTLVIGLIIVIIIPTAIFLTRQNPEEPLVTGSEEEISAFPPDQTRTFPPSSISQLPSTTFDFEEFVAPPTVSQSEPPPPPTSFTTAPLDLKSLIPVLPPAPLGESRKFLPLPAVALSELNVGEDGLDTFDSYLEYFTKNTKNINFDNLKFGKVLRHPSKMFLLPTELIDRALARGDWNVVHESLSIFKEFLSAKIDYLKSIKIKGPAVEWNRAMIGADRLTLELISKAFSLEARSISRAEFEDYYQKYQQTIDSQNKIFKSLGRSVPGEENIFIKFLQFVSLWPAMAEAQSIAGLTFGGLITVNIPCLCIASFNLHFTPIYVAGLGQLPLPDFPLLITAATIASPLLYLYRAPVTGNWILGGFVPNGIPPQPLECIALIPTIPPVCAPIDIFFGVITIAGTSLVP